MNIAQISTLSGRGAGLLTLILNLHPSLRFAEFRRDITDHSVYKDSDSYTGSAARAEGADPQKDAQVPSSVARTLRLYTREYTIDKTRIKDLQNNAAPNAIREFADRRLRGLADSLATEIESDMFSGTDIAPNMLGKLTLIQDAAAGGQTSRLGFTTAELAAMNYQMSLQLNTEANQDEFVEKLMKQVAEVPGANAIEVNTSLAARMTTIAQRKHTYGLTIDQFGVPVETFYNLPLVKVADTVIPMTQSDGVNNDCTSLLIVRYAEDLGVCYSTNTGFDFVDFPELESAPQGKARMDFYTNLTVEKKNAIKRVSRIRL